MRLAVRLLVLAAAAASVSAVLLWRGGAHARARPGPDSVVPAGPPAETHGIRFVDRASDGGLDFSWNDTPHRPLRIIDALGCGCAFFDFDNDGDQDVLLVSEPISALFSNDGTGKFKDVTSAAGLGSIQGAWKGVAIGDYDGDGWLDLLLTGYHRLALLRNRAGGQFVDVTRAAGLNERNWDDWATSAGFMDLDADGDLDLLVQSYIIWGPKSRQLCEYSGIKMGCPPKIYDPERARLFRNDGGRFTNVSASSGVSTTTGVGLVVGFTDADADGGIDMYLGNDAVPADFMENHGGLKFKNVALSNGSIYSKSGKPLAAMGVDFADYDRDGRLDFSVTAFSESSYALFHNDGGGLYTDLSSVVGLAGPTFIPLGFGAKFVDADNDGWPDLFYVNGHVYDRVNDTNPDLAFRQPSMLFRNEDGKRFTDLAPALGGDLMRPILGRGSATGDVDNDGRVDLLAVDYEGKPLLLRNLSETTNHWITLDLRDAGPNSFAYGARVTLHGGGQTWVGELSPASSYLSSSDPRLHFGLGHVDRLDKVEVRWPSGRREEFPAPPINQIVRLKAGTGAARPRK